MASDYQQTTEQEIQARVRSRYRTQIDEIQALNFEELCFFSETLPALGLRHGLAGLIGVLAALPFEVSRVSRDLRASAFYLLLVSREYDTYVSPFGLGTKFYTSFTDGTCVITGNFASQAINDDGEKLYKVCQPCSIAAAWEVHRNRIDALTAGGRQRQYRLSFDDYARLACREDDHMWKFMPFAAKPADIGSISLSAIIFISLLVAVILMFLFLPGIVYAFYPACQYLSGLGKIALPQNLLVISACVLFSWLLARVQKTPYTIDGVGTALHGHTPLPASEAYIATKWIVFFTLPLLPVRTYQVAGESSKEKQVYSMQPLEQFDWNQIAETLWQFKWWYAILALAWIGFGVWSLWKCM